MQRDTEGMRQQRGTSAQSWDAGFRSFWKLSHNIKKTLSYKRNLPGSTWPMEAAFAWCFKGLATFK